MRPPWQGGIDLGLTLFQARELDGYTSVIVHSQKAFGGVIVDIGKVGKIASVALRFYKALSFHALQ